MARTLAPKDPNEVVDYKWFPPLDEGDTITGTPIVTLIAGTVLVPQSNDTTSVTIFFSGGADGETAEVVLVAQTVGGRTWEETFYLPIRSSEYSADAVKLVEIHDEFAAVSPAKLKYWLEQANEIFPDNQHNRMLLACHYMAESGLGTSTESELHREGLANATNIKTGTLSLSFGDGASSDNRFMSTKYGKQVWPALRDATGGPRVASPGSIVQERFSTWDY
ncbi:MAG: DUF4054 domain-containing protein [Shewanella sp.]